MICRTINACKISFVEYGSGPVLLMVHGFPLDHSMWNGQFDTLSKEYRVIAPDLRGFGQSGVESDLATMYCFADDLAALLDDLKIHEPVVVCGLSMGGYIAFEFWKRYPDRLRGLILCDTRASNDSPQTAAARLKTAEKVLSEGPEFLTESMVPKLFSPATSQEHPHLMESIRHVIRRSSPLGIAAAARGMAQRADFTAELPDIRCPVLVVVGEDDMLSPVGEMLGMSQAIHDSRLAVIPHAGHLSPLEQPTAVNAEIENFLGTI